MHRNKEEPSLQPSEQPSSLMRLENKTNKTPFSKEKSFMRKRSLKDISEAE